MRIDLHIGPDAQTSERMQRVLDDARGRLAKTGVLYARSFGARNHTRLFMLATAPDRPDMLRVARGFGFGEAQDTLRLECAAKLRAEIAKARPDRLILSAHQLGCVLHEAEDIARLRAFLADFSEDIHIHMSLVEPALALMRRYGAQVLDGRVTALTQELRLLEAPDYRAAALAAYPPARPMHGIFDEVQGPAFWLDPVALRDAWAAVFSAENMHIHRLDEPRLYSAKGLQETARALGFDAPGQAEPDTPPKALSAAWLERCRRMNDTLLRYMVHEGKLCPRPLWRKLLTEIKVDGPPMDPGSLHKVSARFASAVAQMGAEHGFAPPAPPAPAADWRPADPQFGFRPTQYLVANEWRIKQTAQEAHAAEALRQATETQGENGTAPIDDLLSDTARAQMPILAKKNFVRLRKSPYAPHNRMGMVDENALAAPFAPATPGKGKLIVGCMKNEAPYILEWVAYHRAIGFDGFLIYTNDCSDGTDALLDRLQAMGVLAHRDNSGWAGNSPQQHALDAARGEDIVQKAAWIAHIDVDEFINIRCGNGTLDDLLHQVPEATNIAMTWRLFGHNGVTALDPRPVIEQFDHAAPRYCPKPHTAWGYKTLFRNIGAYGKLSCHRPNRLDPARADQVRWVNGSGKDITPEALKNGWRSSRKSIGYDLVQLNHYALRSAESFLIKRQRGRALHVDRSIGLNYWIRMDWSDVRDITIQRNLPRLRAEMARLLADPQLRALHDAGLDWHRAKAAELQQQPEFAALYDNALRLRLTETERVAWALALDMET